MNLDEIKEIIQADGGKFIIVEKGEPVMVIIDFEDYKKILEKSGKIPTGRLSSLSKFTEQKKSKEESTELKKSTLEEEKMEIPKELTEEQPTIEDLPF